LPGAAFASAISSAIVFALTDPASMNGIIPAIGPK